MIYKQFCSWIPKKCPHKMSGITILVVETKRITHTKTNTHTRDHEDTIL